MTHKVPATTEAMQCQDSGIVLLLLQLTLLLLLLHPCLEMMMMMHALYLLRPASAPACIPASAAAVTPATASAADSGAVVIPECV